MHFSALKRELSRVAVRSIGDEGDEEKGACREEGDDFDLEEYLGASAAERDANGFKRKEVGVVFEKMTVWGSGGSKVSSFVL